MSLNKSFLLTAGLLSASAFGFSGTAAANTVAWITPTPYVPGVCTGIGYEWAVTASQRASLSFVRRVGAKSWNEVPPFYVAPETGWTHTSDWVKFELTQPATVQIKIARQQGVLLPSVVTDPVSGATSIAYTTAGDQLYPALSLYSGWEETGCEDHRYNNSANFAWAPSLDFIANQPNTAGKATAVLTKWLPAGKYSIVIGGANVSFCAETDTCYSGFHGYRAQIITK
ncbi:hypothetical protein [Methylotetracoccus oryzae]|uniref:hypothetical protein n=1 Tax=Methylotetracoccus oryzae TaxID=1919059 RepID=UPI00111936FD|nr:hypothetical protein [Methylotetracoccus oryzae]